jgi:hypothetical protein
MLKCHGGAVSDDGPGRRVVFRLQCVATVDSTQAPHPAKGQATPLGSLRRSGQA